MDLSDLSTPEAGAAHWDARLRSPECTDFERTAFAQWRDADPANRAAFERLQSIVHQLREARHRPELRAIRDAALTQVHSRRRRIGFWSGALAASVAVIVAAGLLLNREFFGSVASPGQVSVTTDVGQHRELTLPDGSTVTVGARSQISVQFSDSTRSIRLEGGEAYFTVAHGDVRPFVVRAGEGSITAVGTEFNVQQIARRVVVTVVEGSVQVASVPATPRTEEIATASTPPRAAAFPVTRVQAGEQLVYGEALSPGRTVNPATAVTWRAGHLKYLGQPLKYVIPDVQRYSRKRLVIADEAVGLLEFTGTAFEDDVEDWLEGLEISLPMIEVVATDDQTVLLRLRAPAR